MAKKKKLNLFENPPSSSSSDEEETQQHNSSDDDSSSSSSDEAEEDDLMNPVKVSSGKKPKSLSAAAVSRRTAVSSAANQPSKSDPGSEKPDENHASTAAKAMNKSKERLDSPSAKSTKKPKEGRSSTAMKSCSAAVPGLTTTSSAAVKSKGKEPVEISPSPAIPGQTTTSAAVKSKGKESAEKPPPIAVPVKTATAVNLSEPEMVKAKEKEIRGSMKSGKETAEISPSPAIPRQTTTSSAVKSKGKEPTEKPPPVSVPVKTALKLSEPISLKAKEKEVRVPVKSGKKRTSENTSKDIDNNLKRTKKKKKVSEEDMINIVSDTKKPMFQRLWSEEDEISLLQGMIDFKTDTGKSSFQDMNAFYESAKKTISFDATKSQFVHKIRSLKRKYMRKLYKGLDSFRDDHDKECLKLANYIWGSYEIASRNGQKIEEEDEQVSEEDQESLGAKIAYWFDDILVGSAEKSNARPGMSEKKPDSVEGNSDKVEEDKEVFGNERDWFEDSFVVGSVVGLGVNEKFMKRKWKEAPMETRKRIEEKLKSLHAKEMEVVAEKTDIMNEVSSIIAK